MSDVANCSLSLAGLITKDQFDRLCEALGKMPYVQKDEIASQLLEGSLDLQECSDGRLPDHIWDIINEANLTSVWYRGMGDNFQSSIQVFDPITGIDVTMMTIDYAINIPFDDKDNNEVIVDITRARDMMQSMATIKLTIANTAHERIAAVDQNPSLAPYVKAMAQ